MDIKCGMYKGREDRAPGRGSASDKEHVVRQRQRELLHGVPRPARSTAWLTLLGAQVCVHSRRQRDKIGL